MENQSVAASANLLIGTSLRREPNPLKGRRIKWVGCSACPNTKHWCKGFCRNCYARWLKRGTPEYAKDARPPKPPCSFDGCERISAVKGLCNQHYSLQSQRNKRGGPAAPGSSHGKHEVILETLCKELEVLGIETKKMLVNRCPYDLLTRNGLRIELKVAEAQLSKGWGPNRWAFNLHRHKKRFDATKVDYLVLAALGRGVWILPAIVGHNKLTLTVSNFRPDTALTIKPPKWAARAISLAELVERERRHATSA